MTPWNIKPCTACEARWSIVIVMHVCRWEGSSLQLCFRKAAQGCCTFLWSIPNHSCVLLASTCLMSSSSTLPITITRMHIHHIINTCGAWVCCCNDFDVFPTSLPSFWMKKRHIQSHPTIYHRSFSNHFPASHETLSSFHPIMLLIPVSRYDTNPNHMRSAACCVRYDD